MSESSNVVGEGGGNKDAILPSGIVPAKDREGNRPSVIVPNLEVLHHTSKQLEGKFLKYTFFHLNAIKVQ